MKINITSRHFKSNESLQGYIKSKIEYLGKYTDEIIYADVILFEDSDSTGLEKNHCEIVLKVKDKLFTSKERSSAYELAVDKAIDKLDAQLYKYKDKLTSKKNIKNHSSYKTI